MVGKDGGHQQRDWLARKLAPRREREGQTYSRRYQLAFGEMKANEDSLSRKAQQQILARHIRI